MVSKLDSTQAAAVYSVPLTVVQYALLVPAVIGTAFFPILATLLKEDRPAARSPFFLLSRLFVFASAPIAVFLIVASDHMVTLVFGTRYAASGPVLAILALNVVLGFQIFLFWYGLLAAYRERGMAALMGLGLAVNLSLNAVLIPAYGPKGAAISLVVSDATILIGQATLFGRHVFAIPFVELLGKPLLATAATVPIVVLLRPTSNLIAAAVGALSFALVLLATRYVSRGEWEPLTVPVGAQLRRLRGKTAPSGP
jgi:O-antigen/teichoic acid export membrane protein